MAEHTAETVHTDTGRNAGYTIEHWLAWLFGVAAIAMTAVGMLRGFGLVGGGDASARSRGT